MITDYCYGSCGVDILPIPHRHPERIPITTPRPREIKSLLRAIGKKSRDKGMEILQRLITTESVLRMHYDWDRITYQDFDKRYPWLATTNISDVDKEAMRWAFSAVALGEKINE